MNCPHCGHPIAPSLIEAAKAWLRRHHGVDRHGVARWLRIRQEEQAAAAARKVV